MNTRPKILMIGEGFIGKHVIDKLKALDFEVEIFTKSRGKFLSDFYELKRAIQRNDFIVLMAAVADLNKFEKDSYHAMEVNVWGLINVCELCNDYKNRLYFISTCCVYGNTKDLPSNEESRPEPSEIYAEAKLAGEHLIKGYHKSYGMEYVILRVATTYGPGMRGALAPAVFMSQILNGEKITVHGDGLQTRTMTYIEDEADGIVAALTHPEVVNETINISTEEETSVMNWIDAISSVANIGYATVHGPDRVGQTFKEKIDGSKAKRLLGFEAQHSFKQGIKKTYDWVIKEGIGVLAK